MDHTKTEAEAAMYALLGPDGKIVTVQRTVAACWDHISNIRPSPGYYVFPAHVRVNLSSVVPVEEAIYRTIRDKFRGGPVTLDLLKHTLPDYSQVEVMEGVTHLVSAKQLRQYKGQFTT